jgi:hypothetical protein
LPGCYRASQSTRHSNPVGSLYKKKLGSVTRHITTRSEWVSSSGQSGGLARRRSRFGLRQARPLYVCIYTPALWVCFGGDALYKTPNQSLRTLVGGMYRTYITYNSYFTIVLHGRCKLLAFRMPNTRK